MTENTLERIDAMSAAERLLIWLADTDLKGATDPLVVGHAVCTSIRIAEIMAIDGLDPVIGQFPATIQERFSRPRHPEVDVPDAFADPAGYLDFLDILEMLSEESLTCISPRLYRGWQDRVQARRDARRITTGTLGFALSAAERDTLLQALALRNRIQLVPPPLTISMDEIRGLFPALAKLIDQLADDNAVIGDLTRSAFG